MIEDDVVIEGEVSSSGSSDDAIGSEIDDAATDGTTTNANKIPIPPVEIKATVFGKRSANKFTGGSNVPRGENYFDATSGPLVVNGDLVLEGDLYVEGDLEIVGSIRGEGSVYTTGDATLFGDSAINTKARISLFSKGHVTLKGFDGDQYLDNVAETDPLFNEWLTETRDALILVENLIENDEREGDGLWGNPDEESNSVNDAHPVNRAASVIGRTILSASPIPEDFSHAGTAYEMRDHILSNSAPGHSRDFMEQKLTFLAEFFSVPARLENRKNDGEVIKDFRFEGYTAGLLDVANDQRKEEYQLPVFNVTGLINQHKIGSSFFQGLIYTNGGFYADNQVTILGAVVVNDDGSQSNFTTADGETINPGEFHLKGGSSITYVKDFFDGAGSGGGAGPTRILLHLGDG